MKTHTYPARFAAVVAISLLLGGSGALAHHATSLFYDQSKKVEALGKITKFVFVNPHAFLFVDAPDPGGKVVEWQIELGAPISLRRTGWTPETMKAGTDVKVVGSPSRAEGTHGMCCARITRLDGTPMAPGGRIEEDPQPQSQPPR